MAFFQKKKGNLFLLNRGIITGSRIRYQQHITLGFEVSVRLLLRGRWEAFKGF